MLIQKGFGTLNAGFFTAGEDNPEITPERIFLEILKNLENSCDSRTVIINSGDKMVGDFAVDMDNYID